MLKDYVALISLGAVVLLCCATYSHAMPVYYDYSDAPLDAAWHSTDAWQKLGSAWDAEDGPKLVDNDRSDDGVFWSVDGGLTWGHEDITIGQKVTFRFDMHRSLSGSHEYDQLKAWIDWNGTGYFWDESFNGSSGERIIAEEWFKNQNQGAQDKQFFAELIVPDWAIVGDTWLRSRVSCDHVSFADTTPYGHLWQGEVEDWKITIKSVPEPATMLLLGTGLIGLVGMVRKKFRKK